MKLGYWKRGEHFTKTHALDEKRGTLCHAWIIRDEGEEFDGSLGHLDCGNCLRILRARLRRQLRKIERRLAGKDGIQTTLLD